MSISLVESLSVEMVVDRHEFQRFRIPPQRVREQPGGTRHHFAEDAFVAPMRDDRQPFGDGRPKSDRVIEMMV